MKNGAKNFWTSFSQREIEKIFTFYKDKVGVRIAKKLVNEIINETLILKYQPQVGQIEELLKSKKEEFRYLVYKNYKIIYWINYKKHQIEIIDVFDTRQNPVKIERHL